MNNEGVRDHTSTARDGRPFDNALAAVADGFASPLRNPSARTLQVALYGLANAIPDALGSEVSPELVDLLEITVMFATCAILDVMPDRHPDVWQAMRGAGEMVRLLGCAVAVIDGHMTSGQLPDWFDRLKMLANDLDTQWRRAALIEREEARQRSSAIQQALAVEAAGLPLH